MGLTRKQRENLVAYAACLDDEQLEELILELTPKEQEELLYHWPMWARPTTKRENGTWTGQLAPPCDWDIWLLLTGRGWGKTRSAAEWIRDRVTTGIAGRIALIAPDPADARDIMIEGESGLLSVFPPSLRPDYQPSKKKITFHTGAVAHIYSAEDPEDLRGPEHDTAWCEELCAWNKMQETWDMFEFGFRLPARDGSNPKAVITTTPKPLPLLKTIMEDEATVITTGSTYNNVANLAPAFAKRIIRRYEGTRLGAQELRGLVLDEAEGALWDRLVLQETRITRAEYENEIFPTIIKIVVAIDPATTANRNSDDTGIIVAARARNGHYYILEDKSGKYSPAEWGRIAVHLYEKWNANYVIGEANNGGDMVIHVVKTAAQEAGVTLKMKKVTASRGKHTRAEPISALWEQKRGHMVGVFQSLEDQMCTWTDSPNDPSPDRMDALVWGVSELLSGGNTKKLFAKPKVGHTGNSWSI